MESVKKLYHVIATKDVECYGMNRSYDIKHIKDFTFEFNNNCDNQINNDR